MPDGRQLEFHEKEVPNVLLAADTSGRSGEISQCSGKEKNQGSFEANGQNEDKKSAI